MTTTRRISGYSTNDVQSVHLEFHPTWYNVPRPDHESIIIMDIVIKNELWSVYNNVPVGEELTCLHRCCGKLCSPCVGKIHIDGKSFTESGISVTSDRLQSINEVNFVRSRKDAMLAESNWYGLWS